MKKLFSKLLMILAIIIAIVVMVLAIYFTGGGAAFAMFGFTITSTMVWWAAAVAIGLMVLAYVIDPKTSSEMVKRAVKPVGDIVGGVGSSIIRGAGEILSSVPWMKIALLSGGFLLLLNLTEE